MIRLGKFALILVLLISFVVVEPAAAGAVERSFHGSNHEVKDTLEQVDRSEQIQLISGLDGILSPVNYNFSPPAVPLAPESSDFGYTMTPLTLLDGWDANNPWWVESTVGIKRSVSITNEVSGAVTIGPNQSTPYDFPFFDETYNSVYIGTNGVVSFDGTTGLPTSSNYPLPTGDLTPVVPLNVIAPLWADFDADPNSIYVQFLDQANPYVLSFYAFVITWENVVRHNTTDLYSFQLVLTDDGDFYANIKDVPGTPGDLTVGIQDATGTDGLTFHYNGYVNPVSDWLSVYFNHPGPDYRMRVYPKIQGKLAASGKANYRFYVKNTTESDGSQLLTNIYELVVVKPAGWGVNFLDQNYQPLTNTPGSPSSHPDTGNVLAGVEKTINVQVTLPSGSLPGEGDILTVQVTPKYGVPRSVELQVAVPSGFANTFSDGAGTYLDLIWQVNQNKESVGGSSGDELVVEDTTNGFIYAWSESNSIKFVFLNGVGLKVKEGVIPKSVVTDSDSSPAVAVDLNTNNAAVVWRRHANTGEDKILYAVLNANDPDGILYGPHSLANSLTATYSSPAAAAQIGMSSKFTLSWVSKDTGSLEIQAREVTGSGPVGGSNTPMPVSGADLIDGLTMEGLPGGHTVLFYISLTGSSASLGYFRLNGIGTTASGTLSSNVSPNHYRSSAALLKDWTGDGIKDLFIAWLDPTVDTGLWPVQGVSYLLLNGSTLAQLGGGVHSIHAPNLTNAEYISVTEDSNGYAVLVWADADSYRYVYYALIDPSDLTPLTPATITQVLGSGSTINLSGSGQGLAPFSGRYALNLPFIHK